jgi:hypothetical protein
MAETAPAINFFLVPPAALRTNKKNCEFYYQIKVTKCMNFITITSQDGDLLFFIYMTQMPYLPVKILQYFIYRKYNKMP